MSAEPIQRHSPLGGFWQELAELIEPVRPQELPDEYEGWLRELFPRAVRKEFAEHHHELWKWVWSIEPGVRPRPFIAIWPRGGGKSTHGELAVSALGARRKRRYVIIVSATQDQADKRLGEIASRLESEAIEFYYPALGRRSVGKYGSSRGWRRNRLHAASGFVVDALGMDVAARGLKVEDTRPDVIILDDLDGRRDNKTATEKKVQTLTDTILPLGTDDCAVLGVQNLIIPDGVFARLAGDADFLVDRIVSGPIPAVRGLETERDASEETGRVRHRVTAGEPTWPGGMDLEAIQRIIDRDGLSSFLREAQHEVSESKGALWRRDMIRRGWGDPKLVRVVVGVDPSGGGDDIGVIVAAKDSAGMYRVRADRSQSGNKGPANWARAVIGAYQDHKGSRIIAEKNYGGDMVEHTIRSVAHRGRLPVKLVSASRGKALRAEPIVALYEDGRVLHDGEFSELEEEMTTWDPNDPSAPSPNRVDALVFALSELDRGVDPVEQFGGARSMVGKRSRRGRR